MRYAILMVLALGLAGCGGGGEGQTATAPTTPVVSNAAPTGALTIVGTLQVGSVLSVSSTVADADGLGVFSYQWYRNTAVISGATSATYQLQAADLGAAITVKVSYVDGKNNSAAFFQATHQFVVKY